MIWIGHAVWCTIHNLDTFFFANGQLVLKLCSASRVVRNCSSRCCKSFHHVAYIRNLVIEGALEFATNLRTKLLAKYGDRQGIRNIEKMIPPSSMQGWANQLTSILREPYMI